MGLKGRFMGQASKIMTGISEQDLLDHKAEDSAHPVRSISVNNTFVNIAGADLQTALEGIDAHRD